MLRSNYYEVSLCGWRVIAGAYEYRRHATTILLVLKETV